MPDPCYGPGCGRPYWWWLPPEIRRPPKPPVNDCSCHPMSCDGGNQGDTPAAQPGVCYSPAAGSGTLIGCVIPITVINE